MTKVGTFFWNTEYNQPQRSTQPYIPLGLYIKYQSTWMWLRRGLFTCVRWQATVCDPVWQMMLCSSEMGTIKSCTHL